MQTLPEITDPEQIDDCNAPHPAAGRPRQQAYRLQAPHPLRDFYVLREKAKYEVPVFVGDPPPRLPVLLAGNRRPANKTAAERARFYCALFVPWHAGDRIDLSPAT